MEMRPDAALPVSWARMYHRASVEHAGRYYTCDRHTRGHGKCVQQPIRAVDLETTVIQVLIGALRPGLDWRERAIEAIASKLGEQSVENRLSELKAIAARMDYRFDLGFIAQDQYLAERPALQSEIDKLAPLLTVSEELERAADILNNFTDHWTACKGDPEKQNELLRLILRRVYVKGRESVLLEFTANFELLVNFQLDNQAAGSTENAVTRVAPEGIEPPTPDLGNLCSIL